MKQLKHKNYVNVLLKELQREGRASKRGKHERKPTFGKVDDFWRNLIREKIYRFYRKKPLQMLILSMRN